MVETIISFFISMIWLLISIHYSIPQYLIHFFNIPLKYEGFFISSVNSLAIASGVYFINRLIDDRPYVEISYSDCDSQKIVELVMEQSDLVSPKESYARIKVSVRIPKWLKFVEWFLRKKGARIVFSVNPNKMIIDLKKDYIDRNKNIKPSESEAGALEYYFLNDFKSSSELKCLEIDITLHCEIRGEYEIQAHFLCEGNFLVKVLLKKFINLKNEKINIKVRGTTDGFE